MHDFSRELHETQGVSDATYQRALDRFGERGVMDLIAVKRLLRAGLDDLECGPDTAA